MAYDVVLNSDQYENTYVNRKKNPPFETRGRLRVINYDINLPTHVQAGEHMRIQKIPAGNSLFMGMLSWAWFDVNRDANKINFGFDDYVTIDGDPVAGDDEAFGSYQITTSTSADHIFRFDKVPFGRSLFSAREGVDLLISPETVALSQGSRISGCIVYVID